MLVAPFAYADSIDASSYTVGSPIMYTPTVSAANKMQLRIAGSTFSCTGSAQIRASFSATPFDINTASPNSGDGNAFTWQNCPAGITFPLPAGSYEVALANQSFIVSGTWNTAHITDGPHAFDVTSGGGGGGGGGGSCGLGCGGIPTAYTAHFSSSTQQAAVIGAVGDLGAFVMGFLPYILALIVALLILGTGVVWLRQKFFREGYNAGTRYAAGEIHKRLNK